MFGSQGLNSNLVKPLSSAAALAAQAAASTFNKTQDKKPKDQRKVAQPGSLQSSPSRPSQRKRLSSDTSVIAVPRAPRSRVPSRGLDSPRHLPTRPSSSDASDTHAAAAAAAFAAKSIPVSLQERHPHLMPPDRYIKAPSSPVSSVVSGNSPETRANSVDHFEHFEIRSRSVGAASAASAIRRPIQEKAGSFASLLDQGCLSENEVDGKALARLSPPPALESRRSSFQLRRAGTDSGLYGLRPPTRAHSVDGPRISRHFSVRSKTSLSSFGSNDSLRFRLESNERLASAISGSPASAAGSAPSVPFSSLLPPIPNMVQLGHSLEHIHGPDKIPASLSSASERASEIAFRDAYQKAKEAEFHQRPLETMSDSDASSDLSDGELPQYPLSSNPGKNAPRSSRLKFKRKGKKVLRDLGLGELAKGHHRQEKHAIDAAGLQMSVNKKPVEFRKTMRETKKSKVFNEDKPWKHHNDAIEVSEAERKRYEGVWVANRGLYVGLMTTPINDPINGVHYEPSNDGSINAVYTGDGIPELNHPSQIVHGYVVRSLWRRSNLSNEHLAKVWNLVDLRKDGTLNRHEFVVGLWLVDQCLYGRKLPNVLSESVWNSIQRFSYGKPKKSKLLK